MRKIRDIARDLRTDLEHILSEVTVTDERRVMESRLMAEFDAWDALRKDRIGRKAKAVKP